MKEFSGIKQAYDALAELRVSSAYPADFQAVEFPQLAGAGEAKMLGNNHAFFFVSNPKGNADPAQMRPDTAKLAELMRNVRKHGTRFTLMVDADVLADHGRFVEKYAALRPEAPETARALLAQEARLIAGFLGQGGLHATARQVIGEGKDLPAPALDALADTFLKKQFRVQGVETAEALEAAVWQVDGPQGRLLARQDYAPATENTARAWRIGTEPQVARLAAQGQEDAALLQQAVQAMDSLPARDIGMHHAQAQGRAQGQSPAR